MTTDTPLDHIAELGRAAKQARADFIQAIHDAHEHGASLRAIAAAAGISHQRVHQLLATEQTWTTGQRPQPPKGEPTPPVRPLSERHGRRR
jgi:hypothetical protein